MKRIRIIASVIMGMLFIAPQMGLAQEPDSAVFVPHWYIQPMGGGGLHLGETGIKNRLSPAAQLSIGRQFSPSLGIRLSGIGWEARNGLAWPEGAKYKWNYIQGTLDVTLSLTDLIGGYNPQRRLGAYALLGAGVAVGWNNDEAHALQPPYLGFEKLWSGTRTFFAARGGLGFNIRISNNVALMLEGNISMLPDKFNSKVGKNLRNDFQVNVLAGLKIALGKTVKYVERYKPAPKPVSVVQQPVNVQEPPKTAVVEKAPEPVVVKEPETYTVDVFFNINSSQILESEFSKLETLLDYMNRNHGSSVSITGYCDMQTGTRQYNLMLSERRANAVRDYLMEKGIAAERIKAEGRGDREQPKDTMRENRVAICVAEGK